MTAIAAGAVSSGCGRSPSHVRPGVGNREAERRLRRLLRRPDLLPDRTDVVIEGHEVEGVFLDARLVVEVDGWAFHRTRGKWERDRRRDADRLAAGWRVLRLTWRQIVYEPELTVARVSRALTAGAAVVPARVQSRRGSARVDL